MVSENVFLKHDFQFWVLTNQVLEFIFSNASHCVVVFGYHGGSTKAVVQQRDLSKHVTFNQQLECISLSVIVVTHVHSAISLDYEEDPVCFITLLNYSLFRSGELCIHFINNGVK